MVKRAGKTNWLLLAVWVAVMAAVTVILVVRFNHRDPMSYIMLAIAGAMWLALALWLVGRRRRAVPGDKARRGPDALTGVLILLALAALCVFLVTSVQSIGIIGAAVVLLFIVGFSRAFADFLKAWKKARTR
jgi:cobalamin synthase